MLYQLLLFTCLRLKLLDSLSDPQLEEAQIAKRDFISLANLQVCRLIIKQPPFDFLLIYQLSISYKQPFSED